MLVLTRNRGEAVKIGEDVWVRVVEVRGNSVRLGFEAPPEVVILREEIEARPVLAAEAATDVECRSIPVGGMPEHVSHSRSIGLQ